jgi:hypothetical protein
LSILLWKLTQSRRQAGGRPHEPLMPDYEPNRVYPFL